MRPLINRTLGSVTGRVVVRADELEQLQRKAARKRKKAKRKPLPADYDGESKQIVRAVRPWTMTGPDKIFALIQAVRYITRHRIPGDVLECGVWRGGSMQAVARTLLALGDTSRDLYLFDTFEGMPAPSERDVRTSDERTAAQLMAEEEREDSLVWAIASLEDVQEGMAQTGYPSERVHYVKGRVEETIPERAPAQISILRLDTDWYESTKHELDHLYPRVPSGGVVLFDDYGYWDGAREAVDEFLETSGERLLLHRMASGRLAVKP
jgi:O-methyltransferase